MQGYVCGGWEVVLIDFKCFFDFYEMCKFIEMYVVCCLCVQGVDQFVLVGLCVIWCVVVEVCELDGFKVVLFDEVFYQMLVCVVGNQEMVELFDCFIDCICIVW